MRVNAVCIDSGQLVLLTPYFPGGDLEQRLRDGGRLLSADVRTALAYQILAAVIYLHSSSPDKPCILHRFRANPVYMCAVAGG